jgi:hypothetical protein
MKADVATRRKTEPTPKPATDGPAAGDGMRERELNIGAIAARLRQESPLYVGILRAELDRRLPGVWPLSGEQVGDDEGEEETDDEDTEDSLAEVLAEPAEPVDVKEVAELLLAELYRVEVRCSDVAEELGHLKFSYDWGETDCAVTVRSARREADDAIDALRALGELLRKWLREVHFGHASIVALGVEGLGAIGKLIPLVDGFHADWFADMVDSAVRHLAECPDAEQIVADFARRRCEATAAEFGHAVHPNERKQWPFTRQGGTPWDVPAATEGKGRRDASA